MKELWLGAPVGEAQYVFLLPNEPILPDGCDASFLRQPDIALLIELNGNHWRKILTIMAKLTTPNYANWKVFRDNDLLNRIGITFSLDSLQGYDGPLFIVGKTFFDRLPIPDSAVKLGSGNAHFASVCWPYIWCPYLDYRQFPNILIESLRECILEKSCLKR
ncbi:hypothetical protein HGG82_01765 [Marinomonas sp. M1K-6]|uniref:Uncharacterized protein n=1 Tax=Marinomonas profundi TaxID=2726122 RepID=A0A847R7V0_9GAMM|nr:hypothetical protein [Marinomonas profundi]NLQ16350.1 hypothetical protein [Marinomonas profundi]UDV03075.1 hypothetical protein J8N69_16230 [Marinomonas profundi]